MLKLVRLWLVVGTIAGLFAVSLCGCHSQASEKDVKAAKKEVERIAEAVKKFHAAKKRYPDKLAELVPGYLAKVPDPIVGDDLTWGYRSRGDSFRMGFEKSMYARYYIYESTKGGYWWVDTK